MGPGTLGERIRAQPELRIQPQWGFGRLLLLFFLTDKQFADAIIACENQKLNYRVVTWSKGGSGVHVTGARFRTTTEFILDAWKGKTKMLLYF